MKQIDLLPHQRISYSEIKKMLACGVAHKFAYVDRLEPIGHRSEALERGTINHAILAEYWNARLEVERRGYGDAHHEGFVAGLMWATTQEWDAFEEPLAQKVLMLYNAFYEVNPFPPDSYKVRSFEQNFGVRLRDDVYYVFSPDLVIEHKQSGCLYVVDFKTIYRFYTQDVIELDFQLPSYVWGLRLLGIDITDAGFLQFYHAHPAKAHPTGIVKTSFLGLSEARIETVADQVEAAIAYRENIKPLRVANDLVCNRCEFKRICIEGLNKRDTSLLTNDTYYRIKEERVMEGVYVNE